ncbi:MAG TPA: hypothetical protein VGO96_05235, partial [Pyrinomonadaceae bacterium]|nr:hypothetical protein [Pyrinomonadaceae bacterium]
VRDTPENIRLIAELLQAIDKDRAEVVMDVNIYEVSRSNLLQLGNQLGDSASLGNLGGLLQTPFLFGARTDRFGSTTSTTTGGTKGGTTTTVGSLITNAVGGSFLLPASTITAFQSKDNTRLLAATQVHAFDSEQSTTRIGQKVPVQTAQVSPFGSTIGGTTGTNTTGGAASSLFGGSGYPVIQYQDTGLILKFTPQVFPNLDVQVKMEIESNDVIGGGAGNLTPTFSQRNVSGMARIPNNRTMMIASVAQDKHSEGRQGIPLLGLIPILGRLFSTPTRNDVNSDIVITVTPRVLRAPTVEPGDIDQRPSGTLQAPVTESLEALLVQADREDQLAAARQLPKDVALQVPTPTATALPAGATAPNGVEPTDAQAYAPAPKALMGLTADANAHHVAAGTGAMGFNSETNKNGEAIKLPVPAVSNASVALVPVSNSGAAVTPAPAATTNATNTTKPDAATPSTNAATTNATPPSASGAEPSSAPLATMTEGGTQLYLLSGQKEMRVGEKQRLMLLVKTTTPLGLAAATLRFDPRVVAVRGVTHGSLFGEAKEGLPSITPSIDARGSLLALIAPAASAPINGMGVLLFVEIEALATGESDVTLDGAGVHLMSVSGQSVATQLAHTRLTVKP